MTQLLTLSRAARLAGVTRAELQKRIRRGEITTFEGEVRIADLLRVYPSISLEKTGMLEQVERIKSEALPRTHEGDTRLPSGEVLVARLRSLSERLVRQLTRVEDQEDLLNQVHTRIAELKNQADTNLAIDNLIAWLDGQRMALSEQPADEGRGRLYAKDTFLRIMSASVKIIPSGHEFLVDGTVSILDAAVRSGLRMSYGCSSGNCGDCKARVVSGEVSKIMEHDYVLSEREKQMGYVLTCSNTAVTDLVLEAAEAHSVMDLPEQEIRAQIRKLEPESDGLMLLHVQTPRTKSLRFMAGQRARLILETGASAELPIASCPCNGRNLQFLVRRREDRFSADIFERTNARQMISLIGPYGDFVLLESAVEPAVFIAFGDGIAPIKSLIEHAVSIDAIESFHLYWTVSQAGEHYHQPWCRALKETLDNFAYTPLVDASVDDIMALLASDVEELSRVRFYLAGPTAKVNAAVAALHAVGIGDSAVSWERLD